MSAIASKPRHESRWPSRFVLLGVSACATASVQHAPALSISQSDILEGPLEILVPPCEAGARLIGSISRQGLELVGAESTLDAGLLKIVLTIPDLGGDPLASRCDTSYLPVSSQFDWELLERPTGSSAALQATDTLTPRLRPDRAGDYQVRFTVCAEGSCDVLISANQVLVVPEFSQTVAITALSQLALPPQTEPFVPPLEATSPTRFLDIDNRCGPAPEVLSAPWRMAREWRGPAHYDLLEGLVTEARVAGRDNKFNHDSQDWNIFVDPYPPFRYLLPALPLTQNQMEVEWERNHYPIRFRPTRGDRTSMLGYWIHDCDHGAKTEIHPPVMTVAHRARPIRLPESQGMGSNVYIAGIVSDIWINSNAGEITRHCDGFGLQQLRTLPPTPLPNGSVSSCLPQTEGFSSNPIKRRFDFRVYLPKNPKNVMAEAGREAPDLNIYLRVLNPRGDGGPNPVIIARRQDDANAFLDVSINLTNFSGSNYSRQIETGWVYPAPDNWGLSRWKLRFHSMDVHNDMDGRFRGDGDWRFWANTNNRVQEWTKIFDCDGCVHGLEDFGGVPWETGTGNSNRSLGPDLLLFPGQRIIFHTSGYEEDGVRSQGVGHVTRLHDQADAVYFAKANTHAYTLKYEIAGSGAVGNADLTPAAQAIYDAFTLSGDGPLVLDLPDDLLVKRDWRHPDDLRVGVGEEAIRLADTNLFHTQSAEPSSLHDISSEDFVRQIAAARETNPDAITTMMGKLREEIVRQVHDGDPLDARADLKILKDVIPDDLWREHLDDFGLDDDSANDGNVPWWWVLVAILVTALVSLWLARRFASSGR
jgi:hypothetical protein